MSKQEKYIEYVVDNLINKTEIDYERKRVKFPFNEYPNDLFHRFNLLPPKAQLIRNHYDYVKNIYGAHSEEIVIIWNNYMETLTSLFKNV
jgi:hypothetical protein